MPDCPANLAPPDVIITPARRLRVLLPVPLPAALDYLTPVEEPAPEPGRFVRVNLGPRRVIGVVWEGEGDDLPAERLRPIVELLPTPSLPAELRRFIDRVAGYTLAPPGMVLRMAMSVEAALLPPARRRVCVITEAGRAALAAPPSRAITPARRRVLEILCDMPADTAAETARRAGVGAAVVRGLVAAGLAAEQMAVSVPPRVEIPDWRAAGAALSPAQTHAAKRLVERVEDGGFSVTVLDGVTGSGKTETYFAAIAAALARGKQVLVLLPEIALSAQWLERFRRRFGASPVEWHSDIGQTQRRDTWRAVADGRASVVVGA
ncbi:MAG TPA: DEAD/DEAH box helicase, partial [Stellaceae bacterium]|nr:DEAD/DEAH box helicase [Stellaceae bacterium]